MASWGGGEAAKYCLLRRVPVKAITSEQILTELRPKLEVHRRQLAWEQNGEVHVGPVCFHHLLVVTREKGHSEDLARRLREELRNEIGHVLLGEPRVVVLHDPVLKDVAGVVWFGEGIHVVESEQEALGVGLWVRTCGTSEVDNKVEFAGHSENDKRLSAGWFPEQSMLVFSLKPGQGPAAPLKDVLFRDRGGNISGSSQEGMFAIGKTRPYDQPGVFRVTPDSAGSRTDNNGFSIQRPALTVDPPMTNWADNDGVWHKVTDGSGGGMFEFRIVADPRPTRLLRAPPDGPHLVVYSVLMPQPDRFGGVEAVWMNLDPNGMLAGSPLAPCYQTMLIEKHSLFARVLRNFEQLKSVLPRVFNARSRIWCHDRSRKNATVSGQGIWKLADGSTLNVGEDPGSGETKPPFDAIVLAQGDASPFGYIDLKGSGANSSFFLSASGFNADQISLGWLDHAGSVLLRDGPVPLGSWAANTLQNVRIDVSAENVGGLERVSTAVTTNGLTAPGVWEGEGFYFGPLWVVFKS